MDETTITQSGNSAGGDVIGHDKNIHVHKAERSRAMRTLLRRYRDNRGTEQELSTLIEELQLYTGAEFDGEDQIGLAGKLEKAGRLDQLEGARKYKELFAKLLARHQLSANAQLIIAHMLGIVHDRYVADVFPLIMQDADHQTVDAAVVRKVIDYAMLELDDNDLVMVPGHIWGMIFYITSKCRIRWSR